MFNWSLQAHGANTTTVYTHVKVKKMFVSWEEDMLKEKLKYWLVQQCLK